ncbi:MerR family transcriptional regulator [Staphylococcus equorum]|uniref:MerR family transcriptional regulator n=3 Tax=Staphylococcus equorum TaxID=246432 RepID=A0AAP7IF98_9STAP|nr:MerR family transcriptional regulator [Staphylococcus equorum]MDK9857878.1 MerR family transcriptional regulator [Staphylococcus equorum]MDK9863471.1 MerR family transcriptional regulator [Staphylococcus equorum]MDK9868844.1 MerR family transcriptional regulator [Staphylococcus equorum]MDK9874938.1 MerR family transcriptional regulator [Staphylococcus equorum]OEK54661.1 MerR family transcriptional regulator [Staphylococcus equorum]
MSIYSTGELAALFSITTRTIQYYDKKGILKPSYVKDNNYRVYTEKEVKKLQIVITLRNMQFNLKDINKLINSDGDLKSIYLLLDQKIEGDEQRIKEDQQNLNNMKRVKSMISETSNSPIQKLLDIEDVMNKNENISKLYRKLFLVGGLGTLVQLIGISISFAIKSYLPFLISFVVAIICAMTMTNKYFNSVLYMCPNFHFKFKPKKLKWMLAAHTPKTRKLKCPNCKEKYHCIETLKEVEKSS